MTIEVPHIGLYLSQTYLLMLNRVSGKTFTALCGIEPAPTAFYASRMANTDQMESQENPEVQQVLSFAAIAEAAR